MLGHYYLESDNDGLSLESGGRINLPGLLIGPGAHVPLPERAGGYGVPVPVTRARAGRELPIGTESLPCRLRLAPFSPLRLSLVPDSSLFFLVRKTLGEATLDLTRNSWSLPSCCTLLACDMLLTTPASTAALRDASMMHQCVVQYQPARTSRLRIGMIV